MSAKNFHVRQAAVSALRAWAKGHDYAETLKHWRIRFMADPDIPTMFDARFRRMWEFYLASAELGFRYGGHMVFQIQLTRSSGALPVTRDYMLEG